MSTAVKWGLVVIAVLVTVVIVLDPREPIDQQTALTPGNHHSDPSDFDNQLRQFCGDCHVLPNPSYFPKENWFAEVRRGFNFYIDSGRSDLSESQFDDVLAWYRSGAPEKLEISELLPANVSPVQFVRTAIPGNTGEQPLVAGVNWDSGDTSPWPNLRLCDMSHGDLIGAVFQLHAIGTQPVAKTGFLATSKVVDLNGDGIQDLVVAEFGWLKSGGIWVLENRHSVGSSGPLNAKSFVPHRVDRRHGTIHVPVRDFNGDGRVDFAALISQEHEVVEAFLNEGGFRFRREKISQPQDPSSGSSGIEMVDIDQDGDQDFVYCLGDTLDTYLIKPYHGVRLLMNDGSYPYREVSLLQSPGACDSAAADFDGDGDIDIAVCGYLPETVVPQMATGTCDTLFWLEQTEQQRFIPHPIEVAVIGHLAIAAGDVDQDGRVDLITGDAFGRPTDWGAVWLNKPKAP